MVPEALQRKMQEETEAFKKLQKDINKADSKRSQLDSQLNENTLVKTEMDLLSDTDTVYKLIGPALIRQDPEEAKSSVDKRIEYISGEMKRQESSIEKLKGEAKAKEEKLNSLMQQYQQMMVKLAAKN